MSNITDAYVILHPCRITDLRPCLRTCLQRGACNVARGGTTSSPTMATAAGGGLGALLRAARAAGVDLRALRLTLWLRHALSQRTFVARLLELPGAEAALPKAGVLSRSSSSSSSSRRRTRRRGSAPTTPRGRPAPRRRAWTRPPRASWRATRSARGCSCSCRRARSSVAAAPALVNRAQCNRSPAIPRHAGACGGAATRGR